MRYYTLFSGSFASSLHSVHSWKPFFVHPAAPPPAQAQAQAQAQETHAQLLCPEVLVKPVFIDGQRLLLLFLISSAAHITGVI
jgi:hypothetical protein